MLITAPVSAHTATERAEWHQEWAERVQASGWLTGEFLLERADFNTRHPVTRAPRSARVLKGGVEQWRGLVSKYFPTVEVDRALVVMSCESGGVYSAKNPVSSASGLFQILRLWWGGNIDPFDPEANIKMAASIWRQGNRRAGSGSNWGHWVCQPDGTRWTF